MGDQVICSLDEVLDRLRCIAAADPCSITAREVMYAYVAYDYFSNYEIDTVALDEVQAECIRLTEHYVDNMNLPAGDFGKKDWCFLVSAVFAFSSFHIMASEQKPSPDIININNVLSNIYLHFSDYDLYVISSIMAECWVQNPVYVIYEERMKATRYLINTELEVMATDISGAWLDYYNMRLIDVLWASCMPSVVCYDYQDKVIKCICNDKISVRKL